MKALRKLFALLVVLVLLGGGVTYALTSDAKIKNSEKLANIEATTQLTDLSQNFINNVNYNNSKLSTKLSIDNEMFLSLLKEATVNNPELQEGTYKLIGNGVQATMPVKLGLWDSQISSKIRVVGANNKIQLVLEDAKIGKVPIPDFALEKYLKEALTGTGVSVIGNTITLNSLGLPVSVDEVEVVGGVINVTASLTNAQLLQYGAQALRGYLGS